MASVYVEQDCTIEHEGRKFESGGAVVTPEYAIGYFDGITLQPFPADWRGGDHVVSWHGERLGSARIVRSWLIHGYVSNRMYQVEATINGIVYTGRTCGIGMIWRGKAKAKQG